MEELVRLISYVAKDCKVSMATIFYSLYQVEKVIDSATASGIIPIEEKILRFMKNDIGDNEELKQLLLDYFAVRALNFK